VLSEEIVIGLFKNRDSQVRFANALVP